MRLPQIVSRFVKWLTQNSVLIVGSAHLDTLGIYRSNVSTDIDKIGVVRVAAGGTALNIALYVNKYLNVLLVSAFRKDSFVYATMGRLLGMSHISDRHITLVEHDTDGGFAAHYDQNGELQSAVTETLVDQIDVETQVKDKWIARASAVVCDLNLAAYQVAQIEARCRKNNKPLIIAGVSESKCMRINEVIATNVTPKIFLLSLNELEAIRLFEWSFAKLTPDYAKQICERFCSRWVVVTRGAQGYCVMGAECEVHRQPAPPTRVESSRGAGDALLAGFAVSIAKKGHLDIGDAARTAGEFVTSALAQPAPLYLRDQPGYRETLDRLMIWDPKLGRPKIVTWIILLSGLAHTLLSLIKQTNEFIERLPELLQKFPWLAGLLAKTGIVP